jgi:endonuclease/exonuclease/phosphatase (EEP) superfamily protein YafD
MRPDNPAPAATDFGRIGDPPGVTLLDRPKSAERRQWPATIVAVCTWSYVAAVSAVWLLLWLGGDRWWLATVMLFGPRWLYAIPWVAIVPVAALVRPRLLWPLAGAALVLLGPIMGLCLPWARLVALDGPTIRVLTCNVKGKCTNNQTLDQLINQTLPDIVALQGCWAEVQIRWPAGWHVWKEGEFVVASHYPLLDPKTEHRWGLPEHRPHINVLHCTVRTPERDVDVFSTHLLSPRDGLRVVLDQQTLLRPSEGPTLAADIEQRSQESEDAERWVQRLSTSPILVGDFNMPTDSNIYRRDWAKYRNAFSDAGLGYGYTEWPRIRGFSWGVRIDHVLTGPHWQTRRCWVGPDVGSDHLPLVADLVWVPSSDGQ